MTKEAKIYNAENLLNKHFWERWSASCKTMKLEHFLTLYTKINSKCFKNMNIRHNTIKLLEENTDKTFFDINHIQFSSVQSLSRVQLFVTPWIASRQTSLSITISRSSLRLMSIESVMPSSHLILSRPLLLLPPIPPSISLFQWVNSSHEVANVLKLQLQHHSFQRNPRAGWLRTNTCYFWEAYLKSH